MRLVFLRRGLLRLCRLRLWWLRLVPTCIRFVLVFPCCVALLSVLCAVNDLNLLSLWCVGGFCFLRGKRYFVFCFIVVCGVAGG